MPTAADAQIDASGKLLNPQDFTPGQINDLQKSGKLNYQNYLAAFPNAGPAADNSADLAAQQAALAARPDLRYGTNAQGQVNQAPGAAPPAPAAAPAPPTALATVPQGGPGAAQMQGGPPLIPYGALGGGAPQTRPAGLSAADRWVLGAQGALNEDTAGHTAEAIDEQRNIAEASAANAQATAHDMQLAHEKFQQDQQEAAQHRANLAQEAKQSHEKIQTQLADLESQGINPNHYWQSQGTGSKILAGIAVGLGAFAAHPLGPHGVASENTALNIINGAIAQDIDAQKVNLQHQVEVARMRGAFNTENFNQQDAMLKAEQDSIQTGYSVAINNLDKQAALYGHNADVQQKAATIRSGLVGAMDERTGKVIEQRYGLMKNAERPVAVPGAGGGIDWKEVRKRMEEWEKENPDASPAEAQRRALIDVTGVDIERGAPLPSFIKPKQGGAGAGIPSRLRKGLADLDRSETALKSLDALVSKGTGFSKSDRNAVDQKIEELDKLGIKLPKGAIDFTTNSTAYRARIAQELMGVQAGKTALISRGQGSTENEAGEAEHEDKPEKD